MREEWAKIKHLIAERGKTYKTPKEAREQMS
jgi:hypothetical protein